MKAGTELAGRYRLDALLGRGGMGEVWAGFDQTLRRKVAVKVLLANLRDDERVAAQVLARFRREGEAAARLNHRNITAVHDLGEHRETDRDGVKRTFPFLVQEFIDGRDLKTLLQDHPGGLPILDALEYGAQICDGLAAAHAAGIVHRDIKPANLILLADGTVKICDFGIARIQDVTAGLTADGARLGTPVYMAPEQFNGHKADPSADLYALGASLYQLLTGRFVFPADDLLALVGMHLTKAPDPPSTYRPAIPPALDALITSLLAKDPAQRPVSASETAGRLRTALTRIRTRLAEAERIARSITNDPYCQAGALAAIAHAVAEHDPARSRALLVEAEHVARPITNPNIYQAGAPGALRAVAQAVAGHDPAEAERIARSITDPNYQAGALVKVAQAVAGHDPARSRALLVEAERVARSPMDYYYQVAALAKVAQAVAGHDPAEAERIARSITDLNHQAGALAKVAQAIAEHDPARSRALLVEAERIAHSITSYFSRDAALREVAPAVARHDPAEAEGIARSITDPHYDYQARTLGEVAQVAAGHDPAEAERIARSITDLNHQAEALAAVAQAVAGHDPAEAERIARSITKPSYQAGALQGVAKVVAGG